MASPPTVQAAARQREGRREPRAQARNKSCSTARGPAAALQPQDAPLVAADAVWRRGNQAPEHGRGARRRARHRRGAVLPAKSPPPRVAVGGCSGRPAAGNDGEQLRSPHPREATAQGPGQSRTTEAGDPSRRQCLSRQWARSRADQRQPQTDRDWSRSNIIRLPVNHVARLAPRDPLTPRHSSTMSDLPFVPLRRWSASCAVPGCPAVLGAVVTHLGLADE